MAESTVETQIETKLIEKTNARVEFDSINLAQIVIVNYSQCRIFWKKEKKTQSLI